MQKPSRTSGLSSAAPPAEGREGLRVDAGDAAALDSALDLAVHYRGDVTLYLRSGEAVCGYVYDRSHSPPAGEARVRIIPADGPRRAIPTAAIAAVEFTGRDTATGRSFETWMKKYVEKKLAGERAENTE